MVRKSQLGSPEFILTPAAPLELALKGMKTVEADLTARLSRQRNEHAKSAGLRKKLAQAQLEAPFLILTPGRSPFVNSTPAGNPLIAGPEA